MSTVAAFDPVTAWGRVRDGRRTVPFHVSCFWASAGRAPRPGDRVDLVRDASGALLEVRLLEG